MKKISKWLLLVLTIVVTLGVTGNMNTKADSNTPATDQYLSKVKAKGELVVGTSPDFPPYEFTKNINGKSKVVGMDMEISKKVAHDMGVKLVIRRMDFDSLLVALQTGKVDMVIAGMSKTPKRAKSVDFSNVYYKAGEDLVIKKSDLKTIKSYKSLAGKAIGAQTGSIQYNLVKNQATKSTLKGMDKDTDLILALQTNKIDAIALDQPTAEAYAKNTDGLVAINAHFKDEGEQGSAIAFPKGAQSLVNSANKSIAEIKAKNLIHKQYLPNAGKYLATGKSKSAKAANSMWAYKDFFIAGVGYTLMISAVSVVIGFLLGTLLALMRLSKNKIANGISVSYIEFVRGTPLMVQILFIYFGLGLVVNIPALLSGIIAVSLNSGAYVAEVIRSGISSIAVGQTEASRSLGLSRSMTMRFIILPQAMKNIWPALGNEFVSLIKESSIVSIIGVKDLIYQSRIVQADTYRGVMPLLITMILYFIMTFGLSRLMKFFEGRMTHE
ncbi:ABC transporter substrate-binding protein/permease [Furfurilactobacillus cerevisiae]|uniref:ABC transporter substrate-binding protein/permease n=1 Tax=Furfurilactobacillus rossiae TaxID=231049 RepID=UPI003B97EB0B